MHYIMDNGNIYPAGDILEWAKWMESADRTIAKTHVEDIEVSTVFLGLSYQFGEGPPLLFETMVFGGESNEEQWRYSTKEEALVGHGEMVHKVWKGTVCAFCGVKSTSVNGKCVHCNGPM